MANTLDTGTATIEVLHAAVKALGSPEHAQRADELLKGYNNVGMGLEVSLRLHRDAMIALLAEAEWKLSFTDEAMEAREKIIDENLAPPPIEGEPYPEGGNDLSVWF
jgi:hypothetical protein